MKNEIGRGVGVGIVGLGLLALVISAPASDQPLDFGDLAADQLRAATGDRLPAPVSSAQAAADSWGAAAKRAAQAMITKYGQPDEISDGRLVWNNTGPFCRTIVYREEVAHNFPAAHWDVLEQFVEYRVPADKHSDLARFNGSLRPDRTAGLLSARGETERDNFIALNLAHEIISGTRTVETARRLSARVTALSQAGKASPYAQGLLFKSRGQGMADADETLLRAGR